MDASSDEIVDEGSGDEHLTTRSHFFTETLGDGWLEVEPGIYLQRDEASELNRASEPEQTLDRALSGAAQPGDDDEGEAEQHEKRGRRLRRLHR